MSRDYTFNPAFLLARSISLLARGRVHFPQDRVGEIVREGEDFVVFRQACIDQDEGQREKPRATLKVRFHFSRGSAMVNKRLSLIPIPFIISIPGFLSKLWMFGEESGDFLGLYEWDTVAAAEAYMNSFAIRLMKRRAIPESLSYEVKGA